MSKKKFHDIWVNQSRLGDEFNMSAIAMGKKLKELGLRQPDGTPTPKALEEGYCTSTPLKNGTPFYMWHRGKVKTLLQTNGLQALNEQEMRCKELAERLIEAEHLFDQGQDKIAYMVQDSLSGEIKPDDIPVINRFLKELSSIQQLEDDSLSN
ncbi:hypothetical protein EPA93_22650 [Ktedonosporobacter rubrisoli]|uniref:Uncharacterized protein n=1 Tax=Ktedonosporobacter rubrisoli TaxID=2509675 RepID=A0A4P6JSV5_KTERU|nr:hypothetical protein [Ktedonosporobacter rubrisoli]QBD78637.1 hypothetical protein EPA93_22650 [Ktedonosporobacter rubrisoli]